MMKFNLLLATLQLFGLINGSMDDFDSLCLAVYEGLGYDNSGQWQYSGGCSQHFDAGSFLYQDSSGTMTFSECAAQCNSRADCLSFTVGKKGVARENWCNLYSVVCSAGNVPDTDWNTFSPTRNTGAAPSDYAVTWQYNGGCQEHFDSGNLLVQDKSGSMTFGACYNLCVTFGGQSFFYGVSSNWCNVYQGVCTNNDDLSWNMYLPLLENAQSVCDEYTCN